MRARRSGRASTGVAIDVAVLASETRQVKESYNSDTSHEGKVLFFCEHVTFSSVCQLTWDKITA